MTPGNNRYPGNYSSPGNNRSLGKNGIPGKSWRGRHGGYSYLMLLFALAILGIVLALQGALYSFDRQREKEADLLRAGRDLQRAIYNYYKTHPANMAASWPPSLEDLLEDTRFSPVVVRHLRQIPVDPMTGTREWGLKQIDGGQIIGVFSTSDKVPIKKDGFAVSEPDFPNAGSYNGWEFVATALNTQATASGATASQAGGTPPADSNAGNAPQQGSPHNR